MSAMKCPTCKKKLICHHCTCAKGGKAKGKRKARTPEQARAAAFARWRKK